MPNICMTSLQCLPDGCWHQWYGPVLNNFGHPIPEHTAPRVSDEHLAFWGEVFEVNNLYAHGIRFDLFIQAPEEVLEALARRRQYQHGDAESLPLLPAQARVARRIELQTPLGQLPESLEDVPTAVMRDGALIEPLRHTRFPRNHTRRASSCVTD